MKKLIPIGFLIVVGIIYLVFSGWLVPQKASTQNSPATITPLQSQVSIKESPNAQAKVIEKPVSIVPVSTISTSASGRALIESGYGHSTILDSDSMLTISQHEDEGRKTVLSLLSGATWSRIQKVFEKGEFYEIQTHNTVAAVRGTSFGVQYRNNISTLFVTEGKVVFAALDESGKAVAGTEVVVSAGEKAHRNGNQKIIVEAITKEDKNSDWYKYNNSATSPSLKIENTTPPPATSKPTPTPPTSSTKTKNNLSITSIGPNELVFGSRNLITLRGSGFLKIKSLVFGRQSILNYQLKDDSTISFFLPENISSGQYDLQINDTEGNSIKALVTFMITQSSSTELPSPTPPSSQGTPNSPSGQQ